MAEGFLIIGGSSSGKSQYAEQLADSLEKSLGFPVYYLATARVTDEEFKERVERHRQRRPGSWATIEEQLDLASVLSSIISQPAICLVDGVGTWMSNLMIENLGSRGVWDADVEQMCLSKVRDFIQSWHSGDGVIIMVADEVGWDLIPEYELGRIFVELNGQANHILARESKDVFFVASGIPVCMKGGINR